jgi:hypothetical protein
MVDQDAALPTSHGSGARSGERGDSEPAVVQATSRSDAPSPDRSAESKASGRQDRDREAGQPSDSEGSRRQHKDEQAAVPGPESVLDYGRPYVSAEQATGISHEGAVFGGESYGFVQTLNRIVVPSAGRNPVAVGPVEPKLLQKIQSVLVPPKVAQQALQILQDQHILVLQGRAHSGKASLALWLLCQIGNSDPSAPDEVYAVAPEERLDRLPDGFFTDPARPTSRYVVDTLGAEAAGSLRLPVLRALSDQLGNGFLVVTVDSRTPIPRIELRDYFLRYGSPPDPYEVLRRNLLWRLNSRELPDDLFGVPWIREELQRAPLPGYLDQLAEVLASVVKGVVDQAEAETAYASFGRLRVEEWFESHPGLRERCLMVAAAVLNGASYHEVADAAEALRTLLEPPDENGQPPHPPSWGLGSSRRQLVEDIGGRIVATHRPTVLGSSPSEVLQLEDIGLQLEVLEHVWWEHEAVRSIVLEWLAGLGRHEDLDVSGRAAAAVGALCRKDLVYLHNRLLIDWATAPEFIARVSAAVALDVVASDRELARQVRALLHRWVRSDPTSPQAWTATAAYGFEVGRRWPNFALRDLRLVVEEAPNHSWIASRSLANLCEAGKATRVLDTIAAWVAADGPPAAAEQALRVFLLMFRAGGDANPIAAGTSREEAEGAPTLLRLAVKDELVRAHLVKLWKTAFHRIETQEQAADTLGNWITLADENAEVGSALDSVALELLMGTPGEQQELAELLRERANDPRVPSDTARRYLLSIGQEISF